VIIYLISRYAIFSDDARGREGTTYVVNMPEISPIFIQQTLHAAITPELVMQSLLQSSDLNFTIVSDVEKPIMLSKYIGRLLHCKWDTGEEYRVLHPFEVIEKLPDDPPRWKIKRLPDTADAPEYDDH
jgi:hypothetical protein